MTQEQKNTKKPDQAEQTSPAHEILSLLLYIVIVFGICFLIITFVGQRSRVSGSSMEPTLSDGDNLIVDKISYRLHDPERFDISSSLINMKKTPIISSVSSVFRARRSTSMMPERSISTALF